MEKAINMMRVEGNVRKKEAVADGQTDRHTDTGTDTQADRHTDGETDR